MAGTLHPILDSPRLAATVRLARQSALIPGTPILIQGESGTGAEELARFIHECGMEAARSTGSFITIKCHGIAESALDAELIGHAGQDLPLPATVRAQSGTLFIEEVTFVSSKAQAALVSWLEAERGAAGVSHAERPSRLVAATNADLRAAVRNRVFRSDLMNELSVLTFSLPALRDRKADIIPLARKWLATRAVALDKRAKGLSTAACQKLLDHRWPGNCRELQTVIERALILEKGDLISPSSVIFSGTTGDSSQGSSFSDAFARIRFEQGRPPTLAELEGAYLVWLLELTHGNRTAASRLLGVSYPTIMKKILDYEIDFNAIAARARPIV
ncbi:MAG TPA: sigma 54-interacting transcriptional regulator [Polyangia bacterium]|nr:sigma 54-interacting transcriptional regulator [Polyangia bacterium]